MDHLRDLPASRLLDELRALGDTPQGARDVVLNLHRHGARDWTALGAGKARRARMEERFRFGPLLEPAGLRTAADGTRKYLFRAGKDVEVEIVLIRAGKRVTACVSSQAGCALGCTFCATAAMGLVRDLSAGEITESILLAEREAGVRVSDVVFMGQGEPLQNYDAVMAACGNLNHQYGPGIGRKHISISTSGLVPQILRFAAEKQRWRMYLSLHAAVQETRAALMPVARRWPLPELLDAMRTVQRACAMPWLTFQYVAIPGVNMDDRHVDALATELWGLNYILNVIPWNEIDAPYRPPTWAEVKDFTTRLRRVGCPVKIRYSAGKREGMGCGQLSAETVAVEATAGHSLAPPGIFTG